MNFKLAPRAVNENRIGSHTRVIGIDQANDGGFYLRRPPIFVHGVNVESVFASIREFRLVPKDPVYCLSADDAVLVGYRTVVAPDGYVFNDELWRDEAECETQLAKYLDYSTPLTHEESGFEMRQGVLCNPKLLADPVEVEGDAVLISSAEPSNFGSWIFRILPKISTARLMGLSSAKFVVWCPHAWQRELLHLAGIEDAQIVALDFSRAYRFKKLHVPSLRNREGYLDLATLNFYDDLLARQGIARGGSRQFYVSRREVGARSAGTRVFMDEAEFEDGLRAQGFEIIHPEKMSILEQITTFASCRMVIGASGSGLFNAVYMTPGSYLVDIEAFPYWLHAHVNLFSSTGLNYAVVVGDPDLADPTPVHKRWTISTQDTFERIAAVRDLAGLN